LEENIRVMEYDITVIKEDNDDQIKTIEALKRELLILENDK
jgi:hypothetical protein